MKDIQWEVVQPMTETIVLKTSKEMKEDLKKLSNHLNIPVNSLIRGVIRTYLISDKTKELLDKLD